MEQANRINEAPLSETPPSQELEELDRNLLSLFATYNSNSRALERERDSNEIPLLECTIESCEKLIIEYLERRKELADILTDDIAEISEIFSTAAAE